MAQTLAHWPQDPSSNQNWLPSRMTQRRLFLILYIYKYWPQCRLTQCRLTPSLSVVYNSDCNYLSCNNTECVIHLWRRDRQSYPWQPLGFFLSRTSSLDLLWHAVRHVLARTCRVNRPGKLLFLLFPESRHHLNSSAAY